LHAVFAKKPLAGGKGFGDRAFGLGLADGDERHCGGIAPDRTRRCPDACVHLGQARRDRRGACGDMRGGRRARACFRTGRIRGFAHKTSGVRRLPVGRFCAI